MSMVQEQASFLLDVARLIQHATTIGFVVTAGELWRPAEMQDLYIKTGRSKAKVSNHQHRLAIDLNFFLHGKLTYDKELLSPIGKYWEGLHPKNRWGGNFKSLVDVPHFERNA